MIIGIMFIGLFGTFIAYTFFSIVATESGGIGIIIGCAVLLATIIAMFTTWRMRRGKP